MSILAGKRIERSEIGLPGEFDAMQDDELDRLIIERFIELGYADKLAISDETTALDGECDQPAVSQTGRCTFRATKSVPNGTAPP
jgi:hypothetical protein